jgi:predicted metal-dependent hydrolase
MMRCMKSRMTLSLDKGTADYISRKAQESGANVSAYVERHFRDQALRESVAKHVEWLKANPAFFEDMEAERDAAAGAA